MKEQFSRTSLIFGQENMEKLYSKRVIVFGIGGVGGFVVEALVRSGIGAIDIVDDDVVCESNLNRQIYALHSTIGQYKVDVAEKRILDINPECQVTKHKVFFMPETASGFDFNNYDYIVDCIDTVTGKIQLVMSAEEAHVPIISSMGAGNKIDPTLFEVSDIYKTSVCPLARVMRGELKKRGIRKLKCVYSTEKAIALKKDNAQTLIQAEMNQGTQRQGNPKSKKQIPGSNAFVPSVAGLIIAGEVIKDLIQFDSKADC